MADFRCHIVLLLLTIHVHNIVCVEWERLKCSSDPKQEMPEGSVADIGRFPWLGIVQHAFYIGGKAHYAVTGAVLIHPAFAIAAAEDIAKINAAQLVNNTKLILWGPTAHKYALEVKDYMLHPEYHDQKTFATIALLDLIAWGRSQMSEWKAPVLPVCLPLKGTGTFENNIYAVKMSDTQSIVEKEILKMSYVENQVCEEFYYKNHLTFSKMNPVNPLCAVSESAKIPCVWDSGTALITRQSWGFWKLVGFAVRGPGCGAPTRFLNIHDYLPWINDIITQIPYEDSAITYKIGMRRQSPIDLFMYNAQTQIPTDYGQCKKSERGNVLFKDSSELVAGTSFAQGFYYLVITTLSEFTCATVHLHVDSQTNAAVWLEHNCHKDVHGLHLGHKRPVRQRMSCYMYFKSTAFFEIRFLFSFKGILEITLFGFEKKLPHYPDPFRKSQVTTSWWPTGNRITFHWFSPARLPWWWV